MNSQNHRTVEVGRDLWRKSYPKPWATQSLFPRTMSRWFLNISKDWGSTASLGNLCGYLVPFMWVCGTVKKCFLMFRGNLLCFSLCPLPLILPLDTTGKSLALPTLQHPFRYLSTLVRSPWAFSSPGWTVPTLSTFPQRRDGSVLSQL